MSGFERGFLSRPPVTRLLARWTAEDEAQRIRERNDEVYLRAIRAWFEQTRETTHAENAR